jgi:all-trans-retinol 13,14-reductase
MPAAIERIVGSLIRAPFVRRAGRTTADTLAALGCSRELAGVLTGQWADYGLPPGRSSFGAHSIVAEHYFNGAAYRIGGAGAILETMLPAIEAAGGRLLASATPHEAVVVESRPHPTCGVWFFALPHCRFGALAIPTLGTYW